MKINEVTNNGGKNSKQAERSGTIEAKQQEYRKRVSTQASTLNAKEYRRKTSLIKVKSNCPPK